MDSSSDERADIIRLSLLESTVATGVLMSGHLSLIDRKQNMHLVYKRNQNMHTVSKRKHNMHLITYIKFNKN
jgi:hypothetical protein